MNARCGGLSERNLKHHAFENKSTQTAFTGAENFLSQTARHAARQPGPCFVAAPCRPPAAERPESRPSLGSVGRTREAGEWSLRGADGPPVAGRTELGPSHSVFSPARGGWPSLQMRNHRSQGVERDAQGGAWFIRHWRSMPMPLPGPYELCWDSLLRENQVSSVTQAGPGQRGGRPALEAHRARRGGGALHPSVLTLGVAQDSGCYTHCEAEGGSWIPTHQAGLRRVCRARSIQATLWPPGSPDSPACLPLPRCLGLQHPRTGPTANRTLT